jgi:iron complex transport system permease protein
MASRNALSIAAGAVLLLAVAWASLSVGSEPVAVGQGLWAWWHGALTPEALIVGEVRLPRTLLALGVGAALGAAGAALQGLLRNPLAEPGLTGASQGAALGAAAVFYHGWWAWAGALAVPMAAMLGATLTLLFMLVLAGSARASMVIMAGLAVATVSGALLALVLNYAPNPFAMQELVYWLMGSVADRGMNEVGWLAAALLLGGALLWSQRRLLAALSLGDVVAESLGMNVRSGARLVVLGSAVLVGGSVAVAGSIGFVGLIVPHLVRPWVRHRPDRLIGPSALLGAVLVCVADMVVRSLPGLQELKLGVLTSLLGAPVFIWLVWRERVRW